MVSCVRMVCIFFLKGVFFSQSILLIILQVCIEKNQTKIAYFVLAQIFWLKNDRQLLICQIFIF